MTLAAVAMLGYLLYRERETLLPRLMTIEPRQLIPLVLAYLADLIIMIIAWAAIANAFGVQVGLARHARIFCVANAARRLPGTLWYIGSRACCTPALASLLALSSLLAPWKSRCCGSPGWSSRPQR